MTSYFPVNFSYEGQFRDKCRVFSDIFNKLFFRMLPEGKVIYFGYCRIIRGSFGADCEIYGIPPY
jgi:hypothetical protein